MMPRKPDRDISKAKIPARVVVSILFVVCLFGMMAGELRDSAKISYGDMRAMHKKVPFWKYALSPIATFVKRGESLFFCRFACTDLYGGLARICGKKSIFCTPTDGHLRTSDDILFGCSGPLRPLPCVETPMPQWCIAQLTDFKDYLESKGIPFLYLLPPGRECLESDSSLDAIDMYMRTSSYAERQRLTRQFSDNNIHYFDAFEEFIKYSPSPQDWFYRTDHHWKIERVFEMMPGLTDEIRDILQLNRPDGKTIFNKDLFCETRYPRSFIGSIGRRGGRFFIPPDDLIYYLPTFDTDFSVSTTNHQGLITSNRGCFEKTLIATDMFDFNSLFRIYQYLYYVYCGADYHKYHIVNHKVDSGRILILKDSMGIPVGTFLSFCFHETMMVDLRSQPNDFNIDRLIEQYQPDIVIIVYQLNCYNDRVFHLR